MIRTILFLILVIDIGVLVFLLAYLAAETADWFRRRQTVRIKRVQQQLAETQEQLQALAFRHDAWLRDRAHEARKALIMESFRASKDERGGTHTVNRRANDHDA